MSASDLEQRLVDLEIRYTHQEHLVEQLSEIVREQAAQIERLERAVDELRASQSETGDAPHDDPPPHY